SNRTTSWRTSTSTTVERTVDARVHFHDEGPAQGGPPQARDPQGDLAVVLLRRQDRRPRPERLGEELAPARDGGRGPGVHGGGLRREGDPGRVPAAGAAARSEEDGARQRR